VEREPEGGIAGDATPRTPEERRFGLGIGGSVRRKKPNENKESRRKWVLLIYGGSYSLLRFTLSDLLYSLFKLLPKIVPSHFFICKWFLLTKPLQTHSILCLKRDPFGNKFVNKIH